MGYIDPHGQDAEEILRAIPSWRADDVVYFNAADFAYPMAWNLLSSDRIDPTDCDRVASIIVSGFQGIFGNPGTVVSFRVGEEDAALLAKHFGGDYQPKHISNLDNYTVCVKQLRNGVTQDPFIGQTHLFEAPEWLEGKKVRYLDAADIVRQSRRHYAERRDVVGAKIERWMTKDPPTTGEGGKSRTQMLDAEIRRRAATLPRKGRTPPGGGGFKSIGDILRR